MILFFKIIIVFFFFFFYSNNHYVFFFFFSSRRRHTRSYGDWSSDVCSSDLVDHVFEERDVGLDTADAELAQAAVHALAGVSELASPSGGFAPPGIVNWRA